VALIVTRVDAFDHAERPGQFLKALARESGIDTSIREDLAHLDR
jgi:hypothetical protein